MIKAIITDFDQTLCETRELKPMWTGKPDWVTIYSRIPQTQIYDGWRCVLQNLGNMPLGIVSRNTKTLITKIIKYHKINCFDFVIGRYGEGKRRFRGLPKTQLFNFAMQHLKGLNANEVLYLGDEATDIQQSNEYGFQSGACFWGTLDATALAATEPTYILKQPTDILTLIKIKVNGC